MDKSTRVYYLKPGIDKFRYAVRDKGCFVLGDPKHGNRRHLAENQILVKTEDEMISLIHKGFCVRVESKTGKSRPSLVRLHLYIDGRKIT